MLKILQGNIDQDDLYDSLVKESYKVFSKFSDDDFFSDKVQHIYFYSNIDNDSVDSLQKLLMDASKTTLNNSNFDFAIISDKEHPNSAFPIIKVDNTTGHLSNWKYSHLIPNGYNQYFYLDSDILFFGNLVYSVLSDEDTSSVVSTLKFVTCNVAVGNFP